MYTFPSSDLYVFKNFAASYGVEIESNCFSIGFWVKNIRGEKTRSVNKNFILVGFC